MSKGKKTNAPPRNKGIIHDGINAQVFMSINVMHCCEQCTHFIPDTETCSMEHKTAPHLYKRQMQTYEMSGKMPLCRNHEID